MILHIILYIEVFIIYWYLVFIFLPRSGFLHDQIRPGFSQTVKSGADQKPLNPLNKIPSSQLKSWTIVTFIYGVKNLSPPPEKKNQHEKVSGYNHTTFEKHSRVNKLSCLYTLGQTFITPVRSINLVLCSLSLIYCF